MKKTLIKLTTALFVLAIAMTSFADDGPKTKAFRGKVTAVADGSITVSNKKGVDQTFTVSPETKVSKPDGSSGAISDIKTGLLVQVVAGSGPGQAGHIKLVEPKKKDAPQSPQTE